MLHLYTISYILSIIYCILSIVYYLLSIISCLLSIIYYLFYIIYYLLSIMFYLSIVYLSIIYHFFCSTTYDEIIILPTYIIYTAHLPSSLGDLPLRRSCYKTGPVALTLSLPFSLSLRNLGTGATMLYSKHKK